jgi:hypothetical protein
MLTITVSILNYEASRATIACVQSLLVAEIDDGDKYQLQIHVADNASNSENKMQVWDGLTGL